MCYIVYSIFLLNPNSKLNIPHTRRFQPTTGVQMRIIRFGGARMATRLWPDLCGADDWCSRSHHVGNSLLRVIESRGDYSACKIWGHSFRCSPAATCNYGNFLVPDTQVSGEDVGWSAGKEGVC